MIALLVSAVANLGQATEDRQEALYRAISARDEKAIRRAIDGGASLRLRAKGHEDPPLQYALGIPKMFDLLRRLGAPVDGVDLYGRTLIHDLVSDTHTLFRNQPNPPRGMVWTGSRDWPYSWEWRQKTVEDLIRRGLNVEARDVLGRTALHYAVQSGWRGVNLLLSLGAKPNDASFGRRGVDLNVRDVEGATPLIVLAKEGQDRGAPDIAAIAAGLLLEAGADLSLRDRNGKSAEDWALVRENASLAALLKTKREDPNRSP